MEISWRVGNEEKRRKASEILKYIFNASLEVSRCSPFESVIASEPENTERERERLKHAGDFLINSKNGFLLSRCYVCVDFLTHFGLDIVFLST